MDAVGRMRTPSTALWGDIASELIHSYAIQPRQRAGELLGRPEYVEAAQRAKSYYLSQPELVPFNRLSHFHAYAMEALCALGAESLARKGMAAFARDQQRNGAVPANPDVKCVCWTATAQ